MKKDCNCHGTKQKCGEFKGNESKEEKLKHLYDCRENFQNRLIEIDKAIKELE